MQRIGRRSVGVPTNYVRATRKVYGIVACDDAGEVTKRFMIDLPVCAESAWLARLFFSRAGVVFGAGLRC